MTSSYAFRMISAIGATLPKSSTERAVVVIRNNGYPFVRGRVNSRPPLRVNLLNVIGCAHAFNPFPTVAGL
jgi:hypothetical protein